MSSKLQKRCPKCQNIYTEDNPPKILVNCSHNICLKCLLAPLTVYCPSCPKNNPILLRKHTISKFKTNFEILNPSTQEQEKNSNKSLLDLLTMVEEEPQTSCEFDSPSFNDNLLESIEKVPAPKFQTQLPNFYEQQPQEENIFKLMNKKSQFKSEKVNSSQHKQVQNLLEKLLEQNDKNLFMLKNLKSPRLNQTFFQNKKNQQREKIKSTFAEISKQLNQAQATALYYFDQMSEQIKYSISLQGDKLQSRKQIYLGKVKQMMKAADRINKRGTKQELKIFTDQHSNRLYSEIGRQIIEEIRTYEIEARSVYSLKLEKQVEESLGKSMEMFFDRADLIRDRFKRTEKSFISSRSEYNQDELRKSKKSIYSSKSKNYKKSLKNFTSNFDLIDSSPENDQIFESVLYQEQITPKIKKSQSIASQRKQHSGALKNSNRYLNQDERVNHQNYRIEIHNAN